MLLKKCSTIQISIVPKILQAFQSTSFTGSFSKRREVKERPWLRLITCLVKFSARGGVGKVLNYMLPMFKSQKYKFCELLSWKYFLILFVLLALNLPEHSYIFTNSQVKKPSKSLLAVLSRVVIQLPSHTSAVL
jgi:hypothetical protein